MESVLQGIDGVCVHIDDILVMGRTEGEHLDQLQEVLSRLKEAEMRLKCEKCEYLLLAVEYLDHTSSGEVVRTETLMH